LLTADDSQSDGACGDSAATGGDSERVTAKTVAQVLPTPRPARGRAWVASKARLCSGPWACRRGDDPSWTMRA